MNNNINILSTSNGELFLHQARAWLNLNESENNTILSIANQAGSDLSMLRPPFWFALAETKDGYGGAAAYALPDGLVLSQMDHSLLPHLLKALLSEGLNPHRIFGPPQLVEAASAQLSRSTGIAYVRRADWSSMVATNYLPPPSEDLGHLRFATPADSELVADFGRAYGAERPAIVDVEEYFLMKLRTNDLYLWVCDRTATITTAIATSGATDTVIRIAGVFTPEAHRCNGFASAAVSTLTNMLLEARYLAITLCVDKSDSNLVQMYRSLGYVHSQDQVEVVIPDPLI
jgi:hypothetical protein